MTLSKSPVDKSDLCLPGDQNKNNSSKLSEIYVLAPRLPQNRLMLLAYQSLKTNVNSTEIIPVFHGEP